MMQIPANFRLDAGITGNQADIVRDLQEIAVGPKGFHPDLRSIPQTFLPLRK